jgi:hypothetical protein
VVANIPWISYCLQFLRECNFYLLSRQFPSLSTYHTACLPTKSKASNPCLGLESLWVYQEFKTPRFFDIRHMKVIRVSALRTGRLYPSGNIPGTHFCHRLSRPQGHSAARRIMSMKNSHDNIGNPTRDLPDCSAVSQPTAPPRVNRKSNFVIL